MQHPLFRKFPIFALAALSSLALTWACSSEGERAESTEPMPVEETVAEEAAEPADPESFPDVVARVNGTDISKEALLERASVIEAQARGAVETSSIAFYRRVLGELVDAELLFQESEDKGVVVESADVDAQLETIKSRLPDEAAFQQALAAEGLTLEELRAQMRRDLSIQRLIENDIAPRVEVTDADMKRFYDENSEQMREPDRLRVSHILKRVPPDASAEDREAAREEIVRLREEAEGGADFAALAREHSEDPGSAAGGGELVITRGQTVPPFEEAAFALEPGGLSNVVETQFGFHIIRLTERMEGSVVPFETARGRIEQYLKQQEMQEEVASAVDALRESGDVEVFI